MRLPTIAFVGLFFVLVALSAAACDQHAEPGYRLAINNDSGEPIVLVPEGTGISPRIGGEPHFQQLDDAAFDISPGARAISPFINGLAGGGDQGPSWAIRIYDAECVLLGQVEVGDGVFQIAIDAQHHVESRQLEYTGQGGTAELPITPNPCVDS